LEIEETVIIFWKTKKLKILKLGLCSFYFYKKLKNTYFLKSDFCSPGMKAPSEEIYDKSTQET